MDDVLRQIQNAFPGKDLKARRHGAGWLISSPHREDNNPSFSVFRSERYDRWMVHDFGDGTSMSLDRYLREYAGVDIRTSTPERKPESKTLTFGKKPNPWKETARVLDEVKAKPYTGHGFDNEFFTSERYRPVDMLELTEPYIWKGKKIPAGSVFFVYRDYYGKPWGIQARIPSPHSKKGRRFMWLVSAPTLTGWDFNRALAVAEGLPKAQMGARLMQHRYDRYAGQKREPSWGYVALAGKNAAANVQQELTLYPNMLAWFLDPDMVEPFRLGGTYKQGKFKASKDGKVLRDIWAQRVMRNRRTVFVEPERNMDINDMVMKYGPQQVVTNLRIIEKPKWTKNNAGEHMLPVNSELSPQEGAVLNAIWAYALVNGHLRWDHGYIFEMAPTNNELIAYSGLNIKTIIKHKSSLAARGIISVDKGDITLYLSKLQPYLREEDPLPPDDNSSVARGFNSIDTQKRATRGLAKLALGHANRRYSKVYGNITPQHIQAYFLSKMGYTVRQVARMLGVSRSLVITAINSVTSILKNIEAALHEQKVYVQAYINEAKERAAIAREAYLRQLAGERGWWVEKWAEVWLRIEERRLRRARFRT